MGLIRPLTVSTLTVPVGSICGHNLTLFRKYLNYVLTKVAARQFNLEASFGKKVLFFLLRCLGFEPEPDLFSTGPFKSNCDLGSHIVAAHGSTIDFHFQSVCFKFDNNSFYKRITVRHILWCNT